MTLEELRRMKVISNTDGKPSANLTDEKWQKEFQMRKQFIRPHPNGVDRLGGNFSKESANWNGETERSYYGPTNYQEYCSYINDVLANIRRGKTDYCYFIYQVMDLARFHYDDLVTTYRDGYWEVRLA